VSVRQQPDTTGEAWNPSEAVELARKSYNYVSHILPPDADLEAIGEADRHVLEAEENRDMDAYVEALRVLCIEARRAAMERRGAA
jgi:hypothetical protein